MHDIVKNCIIVYCESLWWSCDEVVLKSVIKNEIKKLRWITILHTMLWCGWNEVVRVYWRSVTIIVVMKMCESLLKNCLEEFVNEVDNCS